MKRYYTLRWFILASLVLMAAATVVCAQNAFERTSRIRGESLKNSGGGYLNDFFARECWRFIMIQHYIAELAKTAIYDYHPVATAAAVTATAAVTAAVVGSIGYSIPPSCTTVVVNGVTYQQCGSTWYQPQYVGSQVQYVAVAPVR